MKKSSQIIIFLLLSLFCKFSIGNCNENGNGNINKANNNSIIRKERKRKSKSDFSKGEPENKEHEIINLYDDVQELLGPDEMNMLDKYSILGIDDCSNENENNKIISEYDLKAMKSVLLYKNRISRASINNLDDVKTVFKRCFNKDDPELSKSYEQIQNQVANEGTTIIDYLSNYISNIYIKINDEFVKNEEFQLSKYIPELEIINYVLYNGPKEIGNKIKNELIEINNLIISESLTSIYSSVVSGLNINCKIKDDLITILNLANGKYFKVNFSSQATMIIPEQYSHESEHMKKISEYFIEKNRVCKNENCPINSNCYVIDSVETCRCIPGFSKNEESENLECLINESTSCENNNGGCDVNANCILLEDKIMCECNNKFNGDGIYCSSAIYYGMNVFIFFLISIVCIYIM
ncbi:merozoite surface protein 8 [Plasmodium yoelii]|uniref:Merozoite surface protein 8 n=2 Tax=Plasmodium yoelii TaxID=5861 RepID=A0AAE9WXJ5_PLAYO|nr:merozoite surface protein 8 [Plasmodium yoelii]WBY58399.1 merozoite surface protein 8 [Plasmodium yoelii yoelii]AAG02279.1 merozoite surface protein precursor [Plasmodium yoelii]AAW65717.1 merozoite surface protein 8 [Plasmodium yoelii]CDU18727.1 merozoite surface protein 8 [Plasmodium yoelii]VTZ79312.1 merozoite surface protein 8 [Plasmodium yoelii]|eukprot:XP_727065.2 merozoite surface protein 8 [Plasmodium yoelii]